MCMSLCFYVVMLLYVQSYRVLCVYVFIDGVLVFVSCLICVCVYLCVCLYVAIYVMFSCYVCMLFILRLMFAVPV